MNSVLPLRSEGSPAPRLPLRVLSALGTLFWLTLRQHLHGRRVLVLAALFTLPAALVVLLRCLPQPAPLDGQERAFLGNLLPQVLAPLTALLYASSMIQDEVEEQTLTYLLLRPLPRPALYLTRFLATLLTTSVIIGFGATALYLAIYTGTSELALVLTSRLPPMVGVLALAQLGYVALFGGVALLTRRSLLAGVVYIVLIEGVLGNIDFLLRRASVIYHFRVLVVRWIELPPLFAAAWGDEWRLERGQVPAAQDSMLVLAALAIVLLSAWVFARREFGMKTPEGS
jgi:ABC-2 type transport system permease protein